jgi:hypothetical protein
MSPDLGPQPPPKIEPGEPNPGGVDAIDDDSGPIVIPDLTPNENPAIEERAPDPLVDEVKGSEDTSTRATRSEDGEDEDDDESAKESPA